jgi:hypothetical protein
MRVSVRVNFFRVGVAVILSDSVYVGVGDRLRINAWVIRVTG